MKFLGTYIDDTMKWISSKVYAVVNRFGSAVASFTVALLVLVTVFWLALSLHLAFVHAFLPVQSHEWPLHLDFSTCPHRPGLCSEPSATVALQDGLSGEVPTPYLHHQQVFGYAGRGEGRSHVYPSQQGDESGRQHRDKRPHHGDKGWKKGGKSERRGDATGEGEDARREELLQRWQEVLDMEDIPSLPSEQDVSAEEYEAALEQRRMRRLKLFHQAKSSMEDEINIEEDQYHRSPPKCSKPGCSSPPDNGASTTSSLFARGQRYSISVHLEMPDSEANRRLGMFPVEVSLLDGNHALLTTARRPVLLPYRSSEQRFAWSVLHAPSLLLRDSYPETHELELVLFESFVDDPLQPAKFVNVMLRSRFVQVSSCRVSVVASFSGLRRLLHRHPLLSAAVGTLTNMALLLAAITVFYLRKTEKSRLRSPIAIHSSPRQTTPAAVHDVTSTGLARGEVEDLLEEERDAWRRKQGEPRITDDAMKGARDSDEEEDSAQEGENLVKGGDDTTGLSVMPSNSLMGGAMQENSKLEKLHCHDQDNVVGERQHGGLLFTDETSSSSPSPRSSRDHTDDEFTLLPTRADAGAGLRQRATAATSPPPDENAQQ